jgi:hypothetical protein
LDLDGVVAWCADPKAETLDHRLAMLAWHTLIDFGVAEPLPNAIEPHEPDYMLSVVAKKVHDGRAATTNPPTMAVPGWSPPELFLLASTLRAGVDRLGAELKTRDKFSF